ncbi:MAG TPA: hypothetical protein VFJ87_06065, partial [Rhodanobacteraceae bacterium]|nr:hypothetical protein [Rhodanobacteraceae bacterium]
AKPNINAHRCWASLHSAQPANAKAPVAARRVSARRVNGKNIFTTDTHGSARIKSLIRVDPRKSASKRVCFGIRRLG